MCRYARDYSYTSVANFRRVSVGVGLPETGLSSQVSNRGQCGLVTRCRLSQCVVVCECNLIILNIYDGIEDLINRV